MRVLTAEILDYLPADDPGAIRSRQNAARFAGPAALAVYAEVNAERVEVFIRDRGPGFDPATVPADRRGVRESIVGRMERAGGHAAVRRLESGGTEVELTVPAAYSAEQRDKLCWRNAAQLYGIDVGAGVGAE